MAQRKKIYQVLDTQTTPVNQFLVGFGLFMAFIDNKKHIDYHQTLLKVCQAVVRSVIMQVIPRTVWRPLCECSNSL